MQLNSSALNSYPLNGRKRAFVFASAQAISEFDVELVAEKTTHFAGDGVVTLSSEAALMALRQLNAPVMLGITPSLQGGAIRVSGGTSRISLDTSLFYSKTAYGEGRAILGIEFQAVVGVTFIEGTSTLLPIELDISVNRLRKSEGRSDIFISGDLSASAYRLADGDTTSSIYCLPELDPAHITSDGVRYITPALTAPFVLGLKDAGLLRQSYLGDAPISLFASGSGQRIRGGSRGDIISSLSLSDDLIVIRPLQGEILQRTEISLGGNVYVRGSGESKLGVTASGTGVVYRNSLTGSAISTLQIEIGTFRNIHISGGITLPLNISGYGSRKIELNGRANLTLPVQNLTPVVLRRAQGDIKHVLVGHLVGEVFVPFTGNTELSVHPELDGITYRFGSGESKAGTIILDAHPQVVVLGESTAEITLFSTSDAYLNPAATDAEKQQFYRPGDLRDFYRVKDLRDFGR